MLEQRNLSSWLADHYNVPHRSPQILLIHQGFCQHHANHGNVLLKKMLQDVASSE